MDVVDCDLTVLHAAGAVCDGRVVRIDETRLWSGL